MLCISRRRNLKYKVVMFQFSLHFDIKWYHNFKLLLEVRNLKYNETLLFADVYTR